MSKKNGVTLPVIDPETGRKWFGKGRPPKWVVEGRGVPIDKMPTIREVKEYMDASEDHILGFVPEALVSYSRTVEYLCPNNPKHRYNERVIAYCREVYCVHCGCLMSVSVQKEIPCTDQP